MIGAVFFDLDDTLYDYQNLNKAAIKKLISKVAQKYSISVEKAGEAYQYGRTETKEMLPDCAARHNRLLYCQKMLEYLGKNPVKDAIEFYTIYWDNILNHISLNDGVMDLIIKLKEEKIKVGICTDLTVYIQNKKLTKLGLADYIDYLVTSEEAGVEKPSREIFELCIKKTGLRASEVLYIGDDYEKDILGAERLGIRTIWLETNHNKNNSILCRKIVSFRDLLSGEMKI